MFRKYTRKHNKGIFVGLTQRMLNGRWAHIPTSFVPPQGCLEVNHRFKRIPQSEQFQGGMVCIVYWITTTFGCTCFWCVLFCYAPMPVLRLADQQTVSMDKLYFYVLQTDWMLKWLHDWEKKSTELLRDTSLGKVMNSCDADIDWGSNKKVIVGD